MTKTQAKKVLSNPASTDAEKIEARNVLGLKVDGSEDNRDTRNEEAQARDVLLNVGASDAEKEAARLTLGLAADGSEDDTLQTTESSQFNDRSGVGRQHPAARAGTGSSRPLSGEVDSLSSLRSKEDQPRPVAGAPMQQFQDSRGYSNTRTVPAAIAGPGFVQVPITDKVSFVDESGMILGQIAEDATGVSKGEIIMLGGKEFIIGDVIDFAAKKIRVTQNLPQAVR